MRSATATAPTPMRFRSLNTPSPTPNGASSNDPRPSHDAAVSAASARWTAHSSKVGYAPEDLRGVEQRAAGDPDERSDVGTPHGGSVAAPQA